VRKRAPRRKPTGKAKKPPAVTKSKKDAKATDNVIAHKRAAPAHLSSLNVTSARALWTDFVETSKKLLSLSDSEPKTVDCKRLASVMLTCFVTLRNSWVSGVKAKEAIEQLLNTTHWGCVFLEEASIQEKSHEALKALASETPEWPVMLSLRPSSFDRAETYLNDISVGTMSIPPTANMKDAAETRWRELAVMLITKIRVTREFLEIQPLRERFNHQTQKLCEAEFTEASKWKQVLNLLPQLDKQTASKWWEVAGKMLKAHWKDNSGKDNSDEAKSIFEKVKMSAQAAGETPEAYAHRQVRIIFHSLAAKGDKGTDGH
jgi:hypothetical protein